MTCPVCGEKLRPNKGWAAKFYDGYCNTCDMPVENGEEGENDEQTQVAPWPKDTVSR